jgi:hypothetical protein
MCIYINKNQTKKLSGQIKGSICVYKVIADDDTSLLSNTYGGTTFKPGIIQGRWKHGTGRPVRKSDYFRKGKQFRSESGPGMYVYLYQPGLYQNWIALTARKEDLLAVDGSGGIAVFSKLELTQQQYDDYLTRKKHRQGIK